MTQGASHSPLRHALLPAVIFLVVTSIALGAAWALWRSADARDRARFEAESRVASIAIVERMERQIGVLRGAAGLFAADSSVDAADFGAYVDRIDPTRRYPGVLGIGYGALLRSASERAALEERMRETASSDFRIWPAGVRASYAPIVFLSPPSRPNRAALGFDMATDPFRLMALERATVTGEAALTGPVRLVQDMGVRPQPGFVLYLPIYREGRVPVTAGGRREAIAGFAYSPLRAKDFWEPAFDAGQLRQVEVAIYDGRATPANLLFQTGAVPHRARYYSESTLEIAGRDWVVATASRADFAEGSRRDFAWWIVGLGMLTALLLALAARAQARAVLAAERARADLRALNDTLELRVEERTGEVRAAYNNLRGEIERRQGAEEQVRQMQKMEAVGQLTGGIAHDFNNMLAIVIGSLDVAKRRIADPERLPRLLDNAMEGATRAAALTQRLLAFSRRQPLSPERVAVDKLVGGVSELVRRTLGEAVRLEVSLDCGECEVLVDVSQLENAILNLAVNARDAMPGGGSLRIKTGNLRVAEVQGETGPPPGDYVTVAVVDSGEGMPPEVIAKAFEPFFTTKGVGKGTGLGLSQVFGFIQQSGGDVAIESEVGRGTTVRIMLPRLPDAVLDATADAAGAATPRGSADEIVLVVEDEAQVRLISVEALRELGYTVIHAGDGAGALASLTRHPGVRLLFTDVVLPEMSGRELAEAARGLSPGIGLLFTTGYARDEADRLEDGSAQVLPKPFTTAQLATKVRAVLDKGEDHGNRG